MSVTFPRTPVATSPEPVLHVLATLARDVLDVLRARTTSPETVAAGVELSVVTDLARLAELGPAWDRLVFAQARYRPQASHAFVGSYLEHLRAPDRPWACVVAQRGGELVGVLPFLIAPARAGGLAGVHLDAAGLDADLVVAPGEEATLVPALVGTIARAVPEWVAVRFGELQDCSPTVRHLRVDPGSVVLAQAGRSSYIPLPATYDEYLARLTAHFRQNLRRQTRKLFALDSITVEHVEAHEATDAHLEAFIAVEASGWKGREGNAIARRPELAAYYQAATKRLAAAGALGWAILRAEGRPIAVFLEERVGRRLALDKIAYEESLEKVAPGNVLLGLVIERAIASGKYDEIDLLTDAEWNRRWQAETRTTFDVTMYRRSVRGLVPWYVADVARRTWREGRP